MRSTLLVIGLLLIGCQSEEASIEATYFPNVGYLGKGYDVYFGNPLSSEYGGDPGFRDEIFDLTINPSTAAQTADGQYYLPKGVSADLCVVCNNKAEYKKYSSSSQYQEELKNYISVSAGYSGVSFSASTTWRDMYEYIKTDSNTVLSAVVKCSFYCASIKVTRPVGEIPTLNRDFQAWMNYLPESYSESDYADFVSAYGTHVPTLEKYGAMYGMQYILSENDYQSLTQSGVKVEAAVSVSAFGATASTAWGLETNKQWKDSFQSKVAKTFSFSIGTAFPKDTADFASVWQNSAKNSPAPLYIEASPITILLTNRYFPTWSSTRLNNIKANLDRFFSSYCNRLYNQGVLKGVKPDCTLLPPIAAPPPPQPVKCRYCKSCGGGFPSDQGSMVQDGDWGPYKMWGSSCSGAMVEKWDEPHLCCTQDNSNQGCTLCASNCGGAYPYESGRRVNDGDWGYWKTRGTGCNGAASSYRSNRETVLCCKTNINNCKWCSGCGVGMSENGRRVNAGDYGPYKAFPSNLCGADLMGAIPGNPTWNEVTLCCKN